MPYANPAKQRAAKAKSQRKYYARLRTSVLLLLGGACEWCGHNIADSLQVDHVQDDGYLEARRTRTGPRWWRAVLQSVLAGEGKYQLLCANHNWMKRAGATSETWTT